MAKTTLRLVAPDSGLRTVALRRRSNSEMGRDREHLTEREVECLIKAAKGNRQRPPRCDYDPDRFPPRTAGVGALRPAVVVDRVRDRHRLGARRQGWPGSNAPPPR